jgi:hypothetical protein
MWYLYLDESGDLGFDFVNKKPSKHFTICIVAVGSTQTNRALFKAVGKTLRRKVNPHGKRKRITPELKGADTTYDVKAYFWNEIKSMQFSVYSMTLNKRKVYKKLVENPPRVYNWIAKQVLDHIPLEENGSDRIELVIDKCKGKPEIQDFNQYIRRNLEARINPSTPLDIYHWDSKQNKGLQIADMFCWGIFQEYERGKEEWISLFRKKVKYDRLYFQ